MTEYTGYVVALVLLFAVLHFFFKNKATEDEADKLTNSLANTKRKLREVNKALENSSKKVVIGTLGDLEVVDVNRMIRKPIVQPRLPVKSDSYNNRDYPSSKKEVLFSIEDDDFSGGGAGSSWSDSSSSSSSSGDW